MITSTAQPLPRIETAELFAAGEIVPKGPEADNVTAPVAQEPDEVNGPSSYEPRKESSGSLTIDRQRSANWRTRTTLAAAGLLTAACSAVPSTGPVPESTSAPVTMSASESGGTDDTEAKLVAAGYQNVGKDIGLGTLLVKGSDVTQQEAVAYIKFGADANRQALGKTFKVSVDGKQIPVSLSVPPEKVIRAYDVYAALGDSVTNQGFGPDGKLAGAAGKISVSLDLGAPGPFITTTTEVCQGLEMKGVNVLKSQENYRLAKEALCNSLGLLADRAALERPYAEYAADARASRFENVSNGHKLRAIIFDESYFDEAVVRAKKITN